MPLEAFRLLPTVHSLLFGADSSDAPVKLVVTAAGLLSIAALATERDIGTANAIGASVPEWNRYQFNPRAASINSAGAAGTAGTTEVLIGAGVPVLFGGVIFEADSTAAATILVRDSSAVGASLPAQSIGSGILNVGLKFLSGLCVSGSAAGCSAVILWRPLGSNS